MTAADRPSVLFVCVHNAGRSQMAAAYARHLSGGAVEVRSAGSAPADTINPAVREAMLEEGIDLTGERPKILTPEAVQASDAVITMGCGDACPLYPGKRYEDWVLEDPAGRGVDAVRPIRDEIRGRVAALLTGMGVDVVAGAGASLAVIPPDAARRPARTDPRRLPMSESTGFSAAERAAMAERAEELRAQCGGKKKAEALQDLVAKIEAMPEQDRAIAVALHQIVGEVAPDLVRRAVG